MKSFFCHIQSLDRTLTLGDAVSSQTIAAIWQRKQKTAISSWLGVGMSCVFAVTTLLPLPRNRQITLPPPVDPVYIS